jgi:hypothetical protein
LWIGATILAAAANGLLPPPYSMSPGAAVPVKAFAMLLAAAVVGLPSMLIRRSLAGCRALAIAAIAGFAAGSAAYFWNSSLAGVCTAKYDGRIVKVIGTQYTEIGRKYKQTHPDATNSQILDDSAGDPEMAWTRQSIDKCRALISGTYYAWAPLLIFALLTAVRAAAAAPGITMRAPAKKPAADVPAAAVRYDAFVSYRHNDADTRFASELVEHLEGAGFRIAIDERDFGANAHFLREMERCIRESRFTLAIISSAYLNSGNCEEEAVICKIMDMAERKHRLIPLMIEAVALPAWLYGIVGIDFTKANPLVDPMSKLKATLAQADPR